MEEDFLSHKWRSGKESYPFPFYNCSSFSEGIPTIIIIIFQEMEHVVQGAFAKHGTKFLTNELGNMLQKKLAPLKSPL